MNIDNLPETRRNILAILKQDGSATIAELASQLEMTGESIRQHLLQLRNDGYVDRYPKRESDYEGGRPSMIYRLTSTGEHLFPKNYDTLTVEVLDTVAQHLGKQELEQILLAMTEARVREWEPRLHGLSLAEKINALQAIYSTDDTFMEVENTKNRLRLIEHNCPFYNVAMKRPILCSVTTSVLTRLLGYQVVREKRFQNGDGYCAFHVLLDKPIDATFNFSLEQIGIK